MEAEKTPIKDKLFLLSCLFLNKNTFFFLNNTVSFSFFLEIICL